MGGGLCPGAWWEKWLGARRCKRLLFDLPVAPSYFLVFPTQKPRSRGYGTTVDWDPQEVKGLETDHLALEGGWPKAGN